MPYFRAAARRVLRPCPAWVFLHWFWAVSPTSLLLSTWHFFSKSVLFMLYSSLTTIFCSFPILTSVLFSTLSPAGLVLAWQYQIANCERLLDLFLRATNLPRSSLHWRNSLSSFPFEPYLGRICSSLAKRNSKTHFRILLVVFLLLASWLLVGKSFLRLVTRNRILKLYYRIQTESPLQNECSGRAKGVTSVLLSSPLRRRGVTGPMQVRTKSMSRSLLPFFMHEQWLPAQFRYVVEMESAHFWEIE